MPPAHSGGRAPPDVGSGGRVVTRTRAVPDVSVRSFLASGDPPRICWAARDGLQLAGVGAAVRLTADGPDRFAELRRASTALFADVDHEGPYAARPRLLGGVAFDDARTTDDRGSERGADLGADARAVDSGDARAVEGDEGGTVDGDGAGAGADGDARAPAPDDAWRDVPRALFVLPQLQLVRSDDRTWLSATAYGEPASEDVVERRLDAAAAALANAPDPDPWRAPGVERTALRPDRETWTDAVSDVVDRIAGGELEKVVLATAMDVELAGVLDAPCLLERLRERYPDCYRVLVQPTPDVAFFGPPPERLVKVDGTEVRTEALAGSIGRGDTPAADEERARRLLADDKRLHEQQLVVDAISDCLERFGDVTEHERTVRRLATIQHLRTPITASLADGAHVLDLVGALHPTPAVGGLPRERALATIRETESFDRGWYAAPVGWIDAEGDGEFTVAIRTGVARGDRVRLFAGNGIVADSDPDTEWTEIEPKFRPVLDALR